MQAVSKAFLIFLTFLTLSNCSSTKTMQGIMSSWVGSNIDQVIDRWGFPDEEKVVNGRKIFVWNYRKQATLPYSSTTTGNINTQTGAFQSNTYGGGGQTIYGRCTRILEVDDKKVVKSWQWKGNNCPFAEWMEYSKWRKKSDEELK